MTQGLIPSEKYYTIKDENRFTKEERVSELQHRKDSRVKFFRKQMNRKYASYIDLHIEEFMGRITPEERLRVEIGVYIDNPHLFEEFYNHGVFSTPNIKDTPEYKKAVLRRNL